MKKVIMTIFFIIGGSVGYSVMPSVWEAVVGHHAWLSNELINAVAFGIIFLFLGFTVAPFIERLIHKTVSWTEKQSVSSLIFGGLGLIIGLLIGYLLGLPVAALNIVVISSIFPLVSSLILGFIGYHTLMNRGEEMLAFLTRQASKKEVPATGVVAVPAGQGADAPLSDYKILDTSVIIDGRIVDIIKTGFIEGTLLVPQFVLNELQHIADHTDSLKRTKGRRGLDILNQLNKDDQVKIEFYDGDFDDTDEVDAKLVKLAKLLGASLLTNDFNLNKVSEFQQIRVLNINELANAVKPMLIPGESLWVQILKAGTERRQGVAYLEDGTMVVVEDGLDHMEERLLVVVTSALQTAAGRMIFAKISD